MHRSKNTRVILVFTCIIQSRRCSSSHSAEVDRKEGAFKHDKNMVTLGTRSLKVFLVLTMNRLGVSRKAFQRGEGTYAFGEETIQTRVLRDRVERGCSFN